MQEYACVHARCSSSKARVLAERLRNGQGIHTGAAPHIEHAPRSRPPSRPVPSHQTTNRFWLSAGAKPTDKAALLLGQAGVTPMVPEPPRYKPLDPANATKWMKADK